MKAFIKKIGEILMTKSENVQRHLFETLFPDGYFKFDPELQIIDQALDENPALVQEIVDILNKRNEFSKTLGRHSTSAESVLRMIIVKRLFNWSFRFTVRQVHDSNSLRYFTRLYLEKVPHYSVLARYEQLIPEETLSRIHKIIVDIAKKRKITRGRKLRVDTTVVETNMRYPTDSGLLSDSVRVLSRLSKKVKGAGLATDSIVRDFSRSTKRQVLNIVKFAKGRSESAKKSFKRCYRKLVTITKRAVKNANSLKDTLIERAEVIGDDARGVAYRVKEQLEHYLPLIEKVITQTERRVFNGESVPNDDKIISLFEPHSYVIRKGKSHKPNEFGQVVKIQESDGGIITNFERYAPGTDDRSLFVPSIKTHIELFDRPPHLAVADRGFYSKDNENKAYELGVKRVSLPKPGKLSKERKKLQRTRWFRNGQRFRAGCEGRISVLKRIHGFDRCLNKGDNGLDRWIGWGVIAANLKVIANA
jgi:IS5 family transposase